MISPVEMNAVISRTQDIAALRHNEDNKAAIDSTHVQAQMDVKRDEEAYTVQTTNQSTGTSTEHDAKEKGKNEFFDIRRKDRKKKEPDEVVRIKSASPGFDLKI
ncbi:MAG: hypothetical protein IKX95_03335 [Lachnospiraceae bacterium]|nr:hypothetical protein [Lachnospiraceae bacterium]MBR5765796.1 hypothetical protein [Lachnospiraceae bacterium]MBR6469707.1 hypothetical protein [Lachnospiraceae bacterium]